MRKHFNETPAWLCRKPSFELLESRLAVKAADMPLAGAAPIKADMLERSDYTVVCRHIHIYTY